MKEMCYNPIIVTDLKLDLKGRKKISMKESE